MDKNQKTLRDLQQALTDYAAITKKAPGKIIVEKGKQLLFGSHNKYANFKGLYDEFSAVKPRSGEILAGAKSVLSAGGGIKTSAKSRKLAGDILGGNSAGVFVGGKFGNAASRPRLVRQITKGKKAGQHTTNARLKRSAAMLGNQQAMKALADKSAGEFVLNKQNLAVAVEIAKREHARGYSASAFLPNRYKKTIEKLAGKAYKRGQLKGVNSVDACVMHKHIKELVPNRNGAISNIEGDVSNAGAWLKLNIFTNNTGKAGFRRLVQKVVASVVGDMRAYLERKMKNEE